MNSKSTFVWLVIAVALLCSIFVYDRFLRPRVVPPSPILSGLTPSTVTSVQVIATNALEIEADHTNGTWGRWLLTKPVRYPAQSAAVEALLGALQKLTPALHLSARELRQQRNADMDYGFAPPRISLVIDAADGHRWQVKVGNKTAPGDQVFLRVGGTNGAYVTDAGWLKYIPHSADAWRNTALVNFNGHVPDWIVLTNNARNVVIELRRNPTNHLWNMVRPLPTRADTGRITQALQDLQTAHVAQFVTNKSKGDLAAYDLHPPDLDLWLGSGTNFATALHIGNSPTNDSSLVYARRQGWNTVLTTAKEPLSPWFGLVNSFRDPYLFELSAPVAEIQVGGGTNFSNFTLERQGTNGWRVVGQKFPVDAGSVQQLIHNLAGMRVVDFVKDVVTDPDLPAYGLASPSRQITLLSSVNDTNAVIAQLLFGAMHTNEVFVRRADEDSVYAVPAEDFTGLPDAGWEFRERRIWSFSEADVARITVHQKGKTREVIHNGPNKWSLAPGSQGIINPPAIEEAAHELGELTTRDWLTPEMTNAAAFGLKPGNLSITLELKNGVKHTVDFGLSRPPAVVAAVTLEGKRWAFVFPWNLYQLILSYLTIPANVP